MQPDNSQFVRISAGENQLAILDTDGPDGKRKQVSFDMLEINKTLQNIEKNIAKAKSETSQEFHETERKVFTIALTELRKAKRI